MRIMILGIMVLFATGCATTNHSDITFEQAPAPDTAASMSVIYFMRDNVNPSLRNPAILINDQKIGGLPNNSFLWIKVTPGNKLINTKWSWDTGSDNDTVQVDVRAGETYYLILKQTGQIISTVPFANDSRFSSKFFQLNKNDAERYLAHLKYFSN